jgi:pimeloyl-ACP methyl ester carboxylesterase
MTTDTPLDAGAFTTHRAEVRDGVELAYVREGIGGVPLVLVHGWPSTKRIFWRNIAPLAAAGFEVIVPDQRGFGDSPPPARYVDMATSARDLHALVTGLGHDWVIAAGGDWGSGVVLDMANRFPGFVRRQAVWNGVAPNVPEIYEAGGIFGSQLEEVAHLSTHMIEHGSDPDAITARYDTPAKRHAYIREFHSPSGERVWIEGNPPIRLTSPGAFDDAAAGFMAQPFEDAASFRASLGFYTGALGFMNAESEEGVEPALIDGPATVETLVLYGEHDHLHRAAHYPERMELACEDLVGPYTITGSGHFIQFEKPAIFNRALISWCRDLLGPQRTP